MTVNGMLTVEQEELSMDKECIVLLTTQEN